jgi:hypothetical protein
VQSAGKEYQIKQEWWLTDFICEHG